MGRLIGVILSMSFVTQPAHANETDYSLRLKTPYKIGLAPQLLEWPDDAQNFGRVDSPDGDLLFMCTDPRTTEELAARLMTLREYPVACQAVIDASLDELYDRCNATIHATANDRPYTLWDLVLASSATGGALLLVGIFVGGIAF